MFLPNAMCDFLARGVARGGALVPPEIGRSVNPIQTRGGGADYALHTTASPPPGFKKLSTPLLAHRFLHCLNLMS